MLDQIMALASEQSTRGYTLMDAVSRNIGNMNTWGYKSVRFDQYIRPDANVDLTKRVDYEPGAIQRTRRELDIAIDGPGFIQVTRPDGSTAYTRNGSLSKNADGFLITAHGDLVGSGFQILARYHKVFIQKDGTVELVEKLGDQPKTLGKLTLVNFNNPEGLKNIGNNLVVETPESGAPVLNADHQQIRQGALESSNVNVHYAVEDILRINAQIISNLRVIKNTDEVYREAVNLRQ